MTWRIPPGKNPKIPPQADDLRASEVIGLSPLGDTQWDDLEAAMTPGGEMDRREKKRILERAFRFLIPILGGGRKCFVILIF